MVFKQRTRTEQPEEQKANKRRIERKDKGDDAPRRGGKSDNAIIRYFQETAVELRKVAWPTREQTTRLTLIVLGALVVFALFFGALDLGFETIVGLLV